MLIWVESLQLSGLGNALHAHPAAHLRWHTLAAASGVGGAEQPATGRACLARACTGSWYAAHGLLLHRAIHEGVLGPPAVACRSMHAFHVGRLVRLSTRFYTQTISFELNWTETVISTDCTSVTSELFDDCLRLYCT
eukprot:364712-Chlamydomonas_euryale.AAC.9